MNLLGKKYCATQSNRTLGPAPKLGPLYMKEATQWRTSNFRVVATKTRLSKHSNSMLCSAHTLCSVLCSAHTLQQYDVFCTYTLTVCCVLHILCAVCCVLHIHCAVCCVLHVHCTVCCVLHIHCAVCCVLHIHCNSMLCSAYSL